MEKIEVPKQWIEGLVEAGRNAYNAKVTETQEDKIMLLIGYVESAGGFLSPKQK